MSAKFSEQLKIRKLDEQKNNNDSDDSTDDNSTAEDSTIEDTTDSNCKIKNKLKQLNTHFAKIKQLYHNTYLKPINASKNKQQISKILEKINDLSIDIHSNLKNNKTMTPDEKKEIYNEISGLLQELQTMSKAYKSRNREETIRMMKIMDDTIDTETIDGVDDTCMEKYMTQLLVKSDRNKDSNVVTLMQLKEFHIDILTLEESIIQLHQIFLDTAYLIEAQGDQLDAISTNVDTTQICVEEANRNLHKAKGHVNSSRKKCCCLATCGICTVVGGALATGATIARGACTVL